MTDLPNLLDRVVPSEPPALGGRPFLALVGEAPGQEEAEKLRPFVGPSGKLLNTVLRAAGIDRDACWVGNVYSKKLIENEVSAHRKAMGEAAFAEWTLAERSRLAQELTAANPVLVVALGATALETLCGVGSVQSWRGHARKGAGEFSALTVFPTYHPARILQAWNLYNIIIGDFIRAASCAQNGGVVVYPKRTLNIAPSLADVEAAAEAWSDPARVSLLSADIETGWGQIRGVSFSPRPWEEALYVPFISLGQLDRCYWRSIQAELAAWRAVKRLLESSVPKVGQNFAAYDVVWLLSKVGIRCMNAREDTRLLHAALYPELPKSLEFLGAAYSTQGAWKSWGRFSGQEEKRDA
jgi:DNA polymerase